ncbi:HD domain-containing protein [Ureibacillus xyleni]|uniref:HD domain-containing protein n=1 Tax=Ureibacillus xyleni TaxID=614648 RepID=A0A285SMW1_9BACL|nr:HD domain-containing phosphohydrolase [Ureibacillus xyleni]SOC08793.1 HD domain-containing protein [Ureibacillus xyleni]
MDSKLPLDNFQTLFQNYNEDDIHIDSWKILIVDEDPTIHDKIKSTLKDVIFEEKPVSLFHAYTANEAKQIICKNDNIALILLDAVLETKDVSLKIIDFLRNELQNNKTRIFLLINQPNQFPIDKVIISQNINDYKEKSELTPQRLFTSIIFMLRAYRDLLVVDDSKKRLEHVISATSEIIKDTSKYQLVNTIMLQFISLLRLNDSSKIGGVFLQRTIEGTSILIKNGIFDNVSIHDLLSKFTEQITQHFQSNQSFIGNDSFLLYLGTVFNRHYFIYFFTARTLTDWDKKIIDIFSSQTSATFKNVCLVEEIDHTQREIIYTLGEIGEMRSKETGNHVKRVAEFSKLLALKYGLSEEESEIIQLASPMHDIGKVGISDAIMNKPDKLTKEEYEIMKCHAQIGYDMLKHSERPILKAAAIIAHQHHEKYNGTGYPRGLKQKEIHLYGRITAIVDVFDALISDRVYKKGWKMEKIIKYFQDQRGIHFDPELTDIFLLNIQEFIKINDEIK